MFSHKNSLICKNDFHRKHFLSIIMFILYHTISQLSTSKSEKYAIFLYKIDNLPYVFCYKPTEGTAKQCLLLAYPYSSLKLSLPTPQNCIPVYVLVSVEDVLDVTAEKKYT